MKKLIYLFVFFITSSAFGQQKAKDVFTPESYPIVFFGPTTQTIIVDPELNAALGPVPYDRFFYLDVYAKTSDPPIVGVGMFRSKGTSSSRMNPLFVDKIPQTATSPNYKAGYVMYQITVRPLSPTKRYDFVAFFPLSDDLLRLTTDAFFLLYQDKQHNPADYKDFFDAVSAINDKKASDDYFTLDPNELRIYYEEKLKPRIDLGAGRNNELTDDERKTIIYNVLQKDRNITAAFNKEKTAPISSSASVAKVTYQDISDTTAQSPYPVLLTSHPYGNIGFKSFSIDTRTSEIITVDAGYVAYGLQKNLFASTTYIGLDFYLRPFDPNIPFSYVNVYNHLSILDRLSLTLGVSLNSVAKANYRANLFGTNDNLVGGVGIRLNNVFKINIGGLAYYKLDPNFLIDNKKVNVTPYVGASIDIRIGTIFSSFSKLFSL